MPRFLIYALAPLLLAVAFPCPARALEAGAAKVEITPPVGTPLNGYGDRLGRSSVDVHDPLWARAVYVTDGATQIFLVGTDLCMITRELRARVLEMAPTGIPKENIILTATHTHNGPGAMCRDLPLRFVSGQYLPEVLESTAKGIAQAMRTALEGKRRAAIGYGTGKQQVLSKNRSHPGGPIDEQIGVIRVDDADGNALALVANFAAHPTSVPEANHYSFSADYPGFFYGELERLSSEGCVAMLVNGAEGDQTIGNPENQEGWAQAEAVGRLLATRVKGIANEITCADAKLRVATATPKLPRTIASAFMPETVYLQALEINDLLITFFPGEPTVEIGQGLRAQALARGYVAQFTVGLANDYLMYFTPQPRFVEKTYEAGMNFYGPRIAEWFYAEFGKLMSKGSQEASTPPSVTAPAVRKIEDGLAVTLSGSPRDIGMQRALAFADDIHARYAARVEHALITPEIFPPGSLWKAWPPFLDPSPVALPVLAIAARPMLNGVSPAVFEELEGFAEGAGLSFDGAWLLQHAVGFQQRKDKTALFSTPLCSMVALTGDRAGADGLLIGRNFDWPMEETPVITEVRPESGHRFLQVGFTWNAGVYTGMNDAGLVLCVERAKPLGDPAMTAAPVEFVVRDVLQECGGFVEALERLRQQTHLRGYTVLLAGMEADEPLAAVVEFGNKVSSRAGVEGILLGVDPEGDASDNAAVARYGRLRDLLRQEQIVGAAELQQALLDEEGSPEPMYRIWNQETRYSVIFQPRARKMHVTLRGPDGKPGAYEAVSLSGGQS